MHLKHFSTTLNRHACPTALRAGQSATALSLPGVWLRRRWLSWVTIVRYHSVVALAASLSFTTVLGAQARTDQQADTLRFSLAQARAMAVRGNPELKATRLDTAMARGALRQAGLLRFNPSVDVLSGVGANGTEAGVSQEIEILGQRGVRMTAARAAVERARAGVADATRITLGDVDRAFYRLVSATRRTELANEVLALNQRVTDVASRQLAAGEISRLDYNLAVVELGRSRSRSLAARRERTQVEIEFGRLLGMPQGATLAPVIDSTQHPPPADSARLIPRDLVPVLDQAQALNVDSLTARALALRPDLVAQNAMVRQATAEVSLSRREGWPNLIARVASEPRGSGAGRVTRPGVGITLPFFNRNQGEVANRRAAAQQAVLGRAALISRVRADIANAVATYQSAVAEVEVLETTVLQPARQNRQLLETAYREGKVGLPVLLLIRNQVIDAELDYWSAWLAEREAMANLNEATGLNMPSESAAQLP